jgi:hypothetical protein
LPSSTATPQLGFAHPGAWSNSAELVFVKAQVQAGGNLWATQLAMLEGSTPGNQASRYSQLTQANVINSCNNDAQVAQADEMGAYAQALAWYLSGNTSYANRAIAILNDYAGLQSITAPSCWNQQNVLDAGWFGAGFANAAELLRSYPGWSAAGIANFQAMLKRAFYPLLASASVGNGNVDLTQMDAMMSIAVFCDDQAEFNAGIQRLGLRSPSYFYPAPAPAPCCAASIPAIAGDGGNVQSFWFSPVAWLPGLMQETCRDNGHHAQFALGSAIHVAEVAWHQGTDIYTPYQEYFVPALELLSVQITSGQMQGACSDSTTLDTALGAGGLANDVYDTFEVGYNHYALRKGLSLPNTLALLTTRVRNPPNGTSTQWAMLNLMYETLSHAGVQ